MRRVCLVLAMLFWSGGAMEDDDNQRLSAELQSWLGVYAVAYNRQDYTALLQRWDKDEPDGPAHDGAANAAGRGAGGPRAAPAGPEEVGAAAGS